MHDLLFLEDFGAAGHSSCLGCSLEASAGAGEKPHAGNTCRAQSVFKSRASEVNKTLLTIMKVIMNFLSVSVLLC